MGHHSVLDPWRSQLEQRVGQVGQVRFTDDEANESMSEW